MGSGIAIVLAGFLNLVLLRFVGKDRVVWILCLLTNFSLTILFVVGWFIIGEPQVLFGILLFACVTVATLLWNGAVHHRGTEDTGVAQS
jgi:hypothetical protein